MVSDMVSHGCDICTHACLCWTALGHPSSSLISPGVDVPVMAYPGPRFGMCTLRLLLCLYGLSESLWVGSGFCLLIFSLVPASQEWAY